MKPLRFSALFLIFTRLVQGHFNALNQFLLNSLLSRVSYRATSRHRIILVSSRFSTFASLIQSHFKILNYHSFSSLLYFRESRTRPSPGIKLVFYCFSTFAISYTSGYSLPLNPGQSGSRSEPRAT